MIATEGGNGKRPTTEDTVSNFFRDSNIKIDEHTKITFVSGVNTATEEYQVRKNLIERCPLCGIALDKNGVCPKCGYKKP